MQEGAFRTKQSVQMIDFEACRAKLLFLAQSRYKDEGQNRAVLDSTVPECWILESAQNMLVDNARSAARSVEVTAVRSVAAGHTSSGVLPRHPWAYGDSLSVLLQRRCILLRGCERDRRSHHHFDDSRHGSWITQSTLSSHLMTTARRASCGSGGQEAAWPMSMKICQVRS